MSPARRKAEPVSPVAASVAAFLDLVDEQGFARTSLAEVAERAGLDLAELQALAPVKAALVGLASRTLDLEARRATLGEDEDPHDRLFEAVMARLEAMAPRRETWLSLARAAPLLTLAQMPFTVRALLDAAGLEASPPRATALLAVWARVTQVWRDDEGALNRTMAEADRRLRQMREALGRIGAGF
ncbi:MAG: TetR family transcriptional regulator [Alphaproteobacteria bacterium]|nr:TetR family transcriptional regulator [Alphaproteobacteria bacterium]